MTKTWLVAAAVFLAVTVGSFIYLRQSTPESAHQPHPRGQAPQAGALAETAKELRLHQNRSAPLSATPLDTAKTPSDLQRERLLENIGSVSSIYLFQTHLNVGLLADAIKADTYAKDDAAELLATVTTLMQTVDAQMQRLENVGLDEEEVAAVNQVRKVSALLKSQADCLQTYLQSGSQSSLDQFQQVRRESWTELRAVLGLAGQNSAKTK